MTRSQKVVLITGASSGFGKATAEALHARGFCVYATTRAVPAPHDAGSYRSIPMDVDSEVTVAEAVERILREQGRIDVLVNNAGFGVAGAIEDTTVEEARAQLETNFLGTHRLCRAVLPIMRKQRSGRIVNISSLAGLVSVPFQAFYCATKFAVEAYTEALRMEVRKVVAVIESARPRLRYPVANLLQRTIVALRPALPPSWFEYLIMDNYKIR